MRKGGSSRSQGVRWRIQVESERTSSPLVHQVPSAAMQIVDLRRRGSRALHSGLVCPADVRPLETSRHGSPALWVEGRSVKAPNADAGGLIFPRSAWERAGDGMSRRWALRVSSAAGRQPVASGVRLLQRPMWGATTTTTREDGRQNHCKRLRCTPTAPSFALSCDRRFSDPVQRRAPTVRRSWPVESALLPEAGSRDQSRSTCKSGLIAVLLLLACMAPPAVEAARGIKCRSLAAVRHHDRDAPRRLTRQSRRGTRPSGGRDPSSPRTIRGPRPRPRRRRQPHRQQCVPSPELNAREADGQQR